MRSCRGDRWVPRLLGKRAVSPKAAAGHHDVGQRVAFLSPRLQCAACYREPWAGPPREAAGACAGRGGRASQTCPRTGPGGPGHHQGRGALQAAAEGRRLDTHAPACSGARGAGDSRPPGPAALGQLLRPRATAVRPHAASRILHHRDTPRSHPSSAPTRCVTWGKSPHLSVPLCAPPLPKAPRRTRLPELLSSSQDRTQDERWNPAHGEDEGRPPAHPTAGPPRPRSERLTGRRSRVCTRTAMAGHPPAAPGLSPSARGPGRPTRAAPGRWAEAPLGLDAPPGRRQTHPLRPTVREGRRPRILSSETRAGIFRALFLALTRATRVGRSPLQNLLWSRGDGTRHRGLLLALPQRGTGAPGPRALDQDTEDPPTHTLGFPGLGVGSILHAQFFQNKDRGI